MNEEKKTQGPVTGGELRFHALRPGRGSKKRPKRVGRGPGSGHGKTSCRGGKGQTARSGGNVQPGFEGGQMPLQRRLPKRGFHNPFGTTYQVVNVGQLEKLDLGGQAGIHAGGQAGAEISPEVLHSRRLVRRASGLVKVLGDGEITRSLTVRAHAVSDAARRKIEAAGGRVELIVKNEIGK